ncbi:MAG: hypothetical protein K1Y01_18375 [Vicinamibacteria bacterium]|nr:hypothetical protein [Vicinamibacteria bacterium]
MRLNPHGARGWTRRWLGLTLAALPFVAMGETEPAKVIPEAEAVARFRLRDRLEAYRSLGSKADFPGSIEVIDGDLRVEGDLLVDGAAARRRVEALRPRAAGDRAATSVPGAVGLIVTGKLTVAGAIINANLNGGPFLYVLGATEARAMFAGGAEFRFDGLARFQDAVVGCYNDGFVRFAGGVEAPFVISEDHAFEILGARSPYADYFNDDGDVELLKKRLHLDIVAPDVSELDAEEQLLPRIRRGQPIIAASR